MRRRDGARVLRLRTNAGPAVARNAGLGAVTTPLVAFVDTDVRLAPGWLEPLLGHFADDRVALVAPRSPARPAPAPSPATSRATPRSTSARSPAASRPGTRLSYVPAAALVVRDRGAAGDRRLRPDAALRRGRRRRVAARRGRLAVPLRAGVDRPPPAPRPRGAGSSPSASRTARRRRPLARAIPARWHRVRVSGWSAGVWALLATGHPLVAAGLAGGTAAALVRKLPGRPRRRVRPPDRAPGTSTPAACSPTPARRAWWPLLAAGSLVSRRAGGSRSLAALPALLERRAAPPRRRRRLRLRRVEGRARRARSRGRCCPASRRGRAPMPHRRRRDREPADRYRRRA